MTGAQARTTRSFCRICTSLCGILVDVEGDRVVRVRGDRDHPGSGGYTCAKGRALPDLHHHPARLERPQVRREGTLEPTTWEEALDDLGERLSAILAEHGPSSVGVFFGSGLGMDAAGYRTAEALHGAIGTPARFSPLTIDGTAHVLAATMVGGFPGLNSRPDYDEARMVVFVGINPAVSHGHTTAMPQPHRFLADLAERAEVWVVDPRRSETAEHATHHLAARPGTDYAVLAHAVRELLREGVDADAVARQTSGSQALAAAVAPFDREHAARVSGLSPEDLDDFVAAVRRAGRVAVETGTGVTMSAAANVTEWMAWALMAVTGSLNRPGGVWFHPGFITPFDSFEIPVFPEDGLFGPGAPSRPDVNGFLGEWPCGVLADEIEAGRVKALLNLGGGLLTAFPDATSLREAMTKLEVLATLEILPTSSTELSTHVLPTKDQLERADITLWDFLSPRIAAQYTPPVVEPAGDRRSAWWVLAELGRRLGHDLTSAGATDQERLAGQLAIARCSWEQLVEEQYVEVPRELPARWVEEHRERLGGWRLAPGPLVEQLARLTGPAPLVLLPRRQLRHLNSQLVELGDRPLLLVHQADALAAGLSDGAEAVLRSATGEIVARVVVDEAMREGTVSFPHGFVEANVNVLTDRTALDPLTGMVRYSGIPVSLHPAEGAAPTSLGATSPGASR